MAGSHTLEVLGCLTLMAMIACGESHGVADGGAADAGVSDAGAPDASDAGARLRTCDDLWAGSPGDACNEGLECGLSEGGSCLRRYASCPDGELVFDETDRWAGREDVDCPDLGRVSLTGNGPVGDFRLGSGVTSFSHGFAVDVVLIFFDEGTVTTCGTPRMTMQLNPGATGYVGDHSVEATLAIGDSILEGSASVTIATEERLDDRRIVLGGTLEAEMAEAKVRGDFRLVECRDLDRSGP